MPYPIPQRNTPVRALILALALLGLVACGDSNGPERAPVVVIGVDGAEWNVINDMISQGELPNFQRLRNEGAHGYLLNPGPAISPIVWTTFATGRFPRDHGILAHVYPYSDGGEKRPVSSELRQAPALWNIASHYGFETQVIGYFVSHPPETINGTMITSRALSRPDDSIRPVGALDLDQRVFREMRDPDVNAELLEPYFGWTFDRSQAEDPSSPFHDAAVIVTDRNIDRRILSDEFLHRAAMELVDRPSDLFITYYRVVDYMSHSLWVFYDDSDFETPPDATHQAYFGESLRESYRFVDRAIGDLVDAFDGQANIIVISDHGFAAAPARKRAGPTNIKHLTGDHLPNGVLLATGPDIRPGEIRGVTVMEIAPTVAALMGMPLSGEWPGDVAFDLLRDDFLDAQPLQSVPDYSAVRVVRDDLALDLEAEQEDMTTLQGLGYIGEGVDLTSDASADAYDFWEASDDILTHNLMTEALFYLLRGDSDSAQAVVDELSQRRPGALELLNRRLLSKYQRMREQLPPGSLDDTVFEAFLGLPEAQQRGRQRASDDA